MGRLAGWIDLSETYTRGRVIQLLSLNKNRIKREEERAQEEEKTADYLEIVGVVPAASTSS